MIIIKNLIFQFVMFNLMIFINKIMILFIDTIYLFTFWSIITMWILSESFVINNDMKYLENNYKDLINRHNLLLNDFNTISPKSNK